jgi:hypothetical protein
LPSADSPAVVNHVLMVVRAASIVVVLAAIVDLGGDGAMTMRD